MKGDEKALFEAIQENNLGMVKRLVGEGGVNVNAKSEELSTISTAAANGQVEIVKLLLD